MNIVGSLMKIFGERNRPVRCKSRWRKTLERRHRPAKILKANRKNPFMTVMYFPKSEEERQEIEKRNLMMASVFGTMTPPSMLLELAEETVDA